jgi:hypothetical protein
MASDQASSGGVVLTCTPEKSADAIVLGYALENRGSEAVFVFDATADVDPATRAAVADPDDATVWLGSDGYAHVLKGIAAMPRDRRIMALIVPLAVRLGPGQRMTRQPRMGLPLAEQSPYYPPGHVREYRLAEIGGLTLHVDVLVASAPGFASEASAAGGEYLQVRADALVTATRRLSVSFSAKGLHLLVRTDAYPRPD